MARRTSTDWGFMEKPATRASPDVGGNSVVSILIVVVLPAPLEPSKPKTSPALTERVSASTAVNAPKRRGRVLILRTKSLMALGLWKSGESCFAKTDQFGGTPFANFSLPSRVGEQGAAYCHQIKISPVETSKQFIQRAGRRGFSLEGGQKVSGKPN